MIRLFEWGARNFNTNGIGSLIDATSVSVIEELNGVFELEMDYPITGLRYGELKTDSIIVCPPNPYSEPQPFRIYKISKPIDGMVTTYARHISYDLSGFPVKVFNWGDVETALTKYTAQGALDAIKNSVVGECPFSFSSNIPDTKVGTMQTNKPESVRRLLMSTDIKKNMLALYGGEFEYDGFNVILHERRGNDTGYTLQYGKNLTDLVAEEDVSEMYTHVYPYYYVEDDGLQYLDEYVIPTDLGNTPRRVKMLDLTSEFNEMPTQTVLRKTAVEIMERDSLGKPLTALDVSFISPSDDDDYSHLKHLMGVRLGDKLNVRYYELGVDATVRCVKTVYDVISERYESVSLGDHVGHLVDTIAGARGENIFNVKSNITISDISNALDEDKVLTDAETGIQYKWVIMSINGVPEITLVPIEQ